MAAKPESLEAVVDKIAAGADADAVSVRDILSHLDKRAFGPLLLVPFAIAVPGTAVLLFALGLSTRDGRLLVSGQAAAVAAVGLAVVLA